jgi:hypothetical protein
MSQRVGINSRDKDNTHCEYTCYEAQHESALESSACASRLNHEVDGQGRKVLPDRLIDDVQHLLRIQYRSS